MSRLFCLRGVARTRDCRIVNGREFHKLQPSAGSTSADCQMKRKAKLRPETRSSSARGLCWITILRSLGQAARWLGGVTGLVALSGATPLFAQTEAPETARVLFGSLAVSPALSFRNVGWDDNVLNVSKADRQTGDFTATASPSLQAWVHLGLVRVVGRSQVDFVYYKNVTRFRSIDPNNSARVEVLLGRLTPWIGGAWVDTRQQPNFEIDLPIRRVESSWDAGTDLRLTGKTSIGVLTRQLRVDYKGDTIYLATDLANYLDATAKFNGARVRYALTPLTTVGADIEEGQNRFPTVPERNSDDTRVTSVVEFRPLAAVSGRAQVGILRRTFVDGKVPSSQGAVVHADLGYTLLESYQVWRPRPAGS